MNLLISCLIQTAILNSKYYDINQIKNLKTCTNKRSPSLFHLNMRSLPKNFDNFQYLIQSNNIDVTAISESKIIKNKQSIVDMNLPDYSYEFSATEPSSSGTLLVIGNIKTQKRSKLL